MMIIAYLNAIEFIEEELSVEVLLVITHTHTDTHTYTVVCLHACIYYYYFYIILIMHIAWTFVFRVTTPKTRLLLIVRAPFKIELYFLSVALLRVHLALSM